MIELDLLATVLRRNWPIYDPSMPNGYRRGPFEFDAGDLAAKMAAEYDELLSAKWARVEPEGPPPECPTGKHNWYVHEYNTPCYGWDGEINLPPGTIHCRTCFKVKGARRRIR